MRAWWVALACAALATGSAPAQIVERPAAPPVQTQAGLVAGKQLASGVRAWLGVPFAAPPLRDLRWRDPQPRAAWQGVWNADDGFMLTDPVVHYVSSTGKRHKNGATDRGKEGVQNFFKTHKCGPLCKRLGLEARKGRF